MYPAGFNARNFQPSEPYITTGKARVPPQRRRFVGTSMNIVYSTGIDGLLLVLVREEVLSDDSKVYDVLIEREGAELQVFANAIGFKEARRAADAAFHALRIAAGELPE